METRCPFGEGMEPRVMVPRNEQVGLEGGPWADSIAIREPPTAWRHYG